MKLIFASNNQHKYNEIKSLLPKEIELLTLNDIGCTEDIPETAETIEGNAVLKADYVTQKLGYNCFADDSGLEIDALNGEPGVYSARYAGTQRNDDDNMGKVLQKLQTKTNRKANFKTVIALNLNGEKYLFTGIVNGYITTEKRGTNGFGYDPIFIPEGFEKTFAELSQEEKSNISHRGKAVKQLVEFLNKL